MEKCKRALEILEVELKLYDWEGSGWGGGVTNFGESLEKIWKNLNNIYLKLLSGYVKGKFWYILQNLRENFRRAFGKKATFQLRTAPSYSVYICHFEKTCEEF